MEQFLRNYKSLLLAFDDHAKLRAIHAITSFGNWLSFFAILSAIYHKTGNAFTAGFLVGVQSLGQAVSGLLVPFVLNKYPLRNIIIYTQLLAIPILVTIIYVLNINHELSGLPLTTLYSSFLMITLLDNLFQNAVENLSKIVSDNDKKHRLRQSQILSAYLGSQFVGPALSFLFLKVFSFQYSLLIDLLTFVVAFLFASFLKSNKLKADNLTVKVVYVTYLNRLFTSRETLKLLLVRTVLFFIPVGIFNIYLFNIIGNDLKLSIDYSCFAYSLAGLMAYSGVKFTHKLDLYEQYPEHIMSAVIITLMGLVTVPYIFLGNIYTALIVFVLHTFLMGAHKFTSQSLRRKMISSNLYPNYLSIELFLAMLTQWIVVKSFVYLGVHYNLSSKVALIIALPFYFILAMAYIWINLNAKDKVLK